ncbi:Protein MAIN-LIKE 1 [Glycine max]|nr:Protein MAIN-LIKE 1 [Glycine max]
MGEAKESHDEEHKPIFVIDFTLALIYRKVIHCRCSGTLEPYDIADLCHREARLFLCHWPAIFGFCKSIVWAPFSTTLFRELLGAPSNIAGAPSNLLKGQFCPSFKNIKNFIPLSEAFCLLSSAKKLLKAFLLSSLFREKAFCLLLFFSARLLRLHLLREACLPFAFEIMARTRGLGRAIGRVVGRDGAADEDAGDVPERRRPTASARRLRVHQMTTEGRDMAEDVADMTDDVPEQPTEAPEMRADAQGADSGEGSDGDDAAEGFPGGPRDPSVLTSFAEHVAHAVWSGQERPDLKLVSHGRKLTLIGRPVPEIEGLVAATGLSPLIDCSVITGDPGLISAFVERWHSETSTFHLPVGELTITLDDVSSILHLPITGALHSFHALSTEEARFLLTELLEVSAEEARAEIALTRGAYVRLGWVRDIYETRCQARRWIVAARAYLLHLVGCTLFANKSATYVHVVHLDAFRDLAHSGGYAWGVAALVHMYDQLDEAWRTTTRQLAGYLTLFQYWIYEHFPSVHQCVTDDTYQETSPRASRWLTSKAHMKGITGAPYRARCDGLTVTDVSWLPYTEHRGVRAFQEISSFQGQLRWGPMIVAVRPERVVRQFGYIQSIPPPPVSARLSQDQIDDRWMEFADHLLPAGQPCLVPGQVSADYIEWFFRISHPFMTPTQAADQQRDAPAADPEDYIQPPSPQVPVAFDPPPYVDDYEGYEAIAQRLERVLNLRIVTAGTELYDIMQDCLTIARGGPSADGTIMVKTRGLGRALGQRVAVTVAHDELVIPTPDVQDDPMEAPAAVEDIVADIPVVTGAEAAEDEHEGFPGVVTPGSSTHEVIEECLRLARSVTQDHLVYIRSRRRRRTDQAYYMSNFKC